jgi:hypothetical protein
MQIPRTHLSCAQSLNKSNPEQLIRVNWSCELNDTENRYLETPAHWEKKKYLCPSISDYRGTENENSK